MIWRLGELERQFRGHLSRVGAEIDPSLGGIQMFASLEDDAQQRGLRAGAFVEIRVPDIIYHDVYRLPAKALSENAYVYVIADDRLQKVAVKLVRKLGDEVLVRAELSVDQAIVARTFAGIGPGLRARAL